MLRPSTMNAGIPSDSRLVDQESGLPQPEGRAVGAVVAALVALLVLNAFVFLRDVDSPLLLGGIIAADMLAMGLAVLVAARAVLSAEENTTLARVALKQSEHRLAQIVDTAMDAIITVNAEQRIVLFNSAAEQLFRCRAAKALGAPFDRFVPQRSRGALRDHIDRLARMNIADRRTAAMSTLWGLRSDGEEFPMEASISMAGEAEAWMCTVILRDVTQRMQHESEVRRQQQELRELSAKVLEAREEEKTLIAREVHDELGQLLTALKMDLLWIRQRVSGDADIAQRAAEMNRMLEETVAATRRISADLRPLMLDDCGLADAAAWYVEDFGKRSGISCEFQQVGALEVENVSRPVATTVYRALQESLTNIARHAAANNAWVMLQLEEDMVTLEVKDDGRGIDAKDVLKENSLGLKGMRERVTYLRGSFQVDRIAGGGTCVRVRVPPKAVPSGVQA